ncbi:MAG TPA: tetratricopeptide repeat protein [Verrucomicrobiae bacterium]|nr:tetratricopeptide repeat protein [Verrucomicrobiae bacterium]
MRGKLLTILTAAMLAFGASSAFAESKGDNAYRRGDYAGAMVEWQQVAQAGDATASYRIGQLYRQGKGLRYRDFEKAVYWYQRAAGRGYVPAQYEVARLQFEGLMVPRDIDEMMYWLWRAALSGHADSQVMLGCVYEYGEPGVAANYMEALKWYLVAAKSGPPELQARALKLAERVSAKMTPEQIDAARWLASEWAVNDILQLAEAYGAEGASRSNRPSSLSVSK